MPNVGELKNIDTPVSAPPVTTGTGVLTLLNGCQQGITATTRLGRRVTLKSIYIRANFQVASATTGSCPVRILIVQDRQPNGAAPTAIDILAADQINGLNNLSNSRRFVTHFDHVIPVIGTAGPQAQSAVLHKNVNIPVEFNSGTLGTVADISSNSLYALVYANNGTGTAAINSLIQCRVRFSDN